MQACLIEAIEAFKSRIAPVFANLSSREAEIKALKKSLTTKQTALRNAKQEVSSLTADVSGLQRQKAALERQNEAALQTASEAAAEVLTLRNKHLEADAAKKDVERLEEGAREKDKELGKYKDWIDQHKKKVCTFRTSYYYSLI
jgi:chromosome segregation ATPase